MSMDSRESGSSAKPSIGNSDVARILDRIADLLEFKNEIFFKVRSYRTASGAISDLDRPVGEAVAQGGAAELQKIPGIGKGISAQIVEIVNTGTSAYFDELTREVPESVLDLRRVSGIGLKTAQALFHDFGIKNLEDLKRFAEGGGLLSVPGIGEKTVERVKRSITRLELEGKAIGSRFGTD
jgi:DNA polymerase (family 10)